MKKWYSNEIVTHNVWGKYYLFYVYEYLICMYAAAPYVCRAWETRRGYPLKLDLEMSVSNHVGAGNVTQVLLRKSSKCSSLLNHLSSPHWKHSGKG